MSLLAGVDGCRGGWVVVLAEADPLRLVDVRLIEAISDLDEIGPVLTAIDMPIGLAEVPEPGGRACDREARRLLRPHRHTSVFSPPCRAALFAPSYEEANRLNRASGEGAPGLSKQAYNLFPKIREVDAWVAARPETRVFEVHPELSFAALNDGTALSERKKAQAGRDQRLGLLTAAGLGGIAAFLDSWPRSRLAPDDLIDAAALAWSSERLMRGTATRLGTSEDSSRPAIHF